jgi:cytochrome P450
LASSASESTNATAAPTLSIDPFGDTFLTAPYSYHGVLRDAGPVVWLKAVGVYGMARFAEVQLALRDHDVYRSGRGVGLSDFAVETPWRSPSLLLEADPPLHDRTRGIMNNIVSLKALKAIRPIWAERAAQLVDALVAKRRFDAVTELAEAYPMLVFPDTIGVPTQGREHLIAYAAAVFNAFGPRNAIFDRDNARAADAMAWVFNACGRENLTPGGWGAAVYQAADSGACSESEAERLVRSFLSAGVDTTINGIGHMMLALASFPKEYERLRRNPTLAKRAFEESLRWDSTVQTFFRTTSRDITVSGVTIPADAKVLLFLAAANRDPRKWEAPEAYDISRATSGHVGFGFGIHQCLGQMVARLEGELILEALVPRVRSIRLTGPPIRRLNNTLHALASLPVEVEPV